MSYASPVPSPICQAGGEAGVDPSSRVLSVEVQRL